MTLASAPDAVTFQTAARKSRDMSKRKTAEQSLHLDHAPGYLPDGVSAHSHATAKGHAMSSPKFQDRPPEQPQRWRTLSQLIAKNKSELKTIEEKLKGNVGHAERAKLDSDCDIKHRFLAKLLAEQDQNDPQRGEP